MTPRACSLIFGACVLLAGKARAQNTVVGTVVDDATGRPIAGAMASLSVGEARRVTRTDERGEFRFTNVGTGRVSLSIRVLGFAPHAEQLDVRAEMPPTAVRLRRIATLDTVRVRAAKQGLYGVVATAADLRPLPNAKLRIIGIGGGPVDLDSTAHFFVPIKTIGSYVIRATAPGFLDQTMSVIVAPNDGVEVAFLLDSAVNGVSHKLDLPYLDFDERIKRRGLGSALVPRTEIMKNSTTTLVNSLRYSPSFLARNLRWDLTACVFVDGRPRPGMSLNDIPIDEVEAVEVYTQPTDPFSHRVGDRSRTLLNSWPRSGMCGDTGVPAGASRGQRDDLIKWVVIWLKQ